MSYLRDVLIKKEQVVKQNCSETQQGTYVPLSCLLDEMISELNADVTGNLTGSVTGGGTAGTVGTGVTQNVVSLGNKRIVELTLTNVNTGTIAGAGAEDQGVLIYTLPAGDIQVHPTSIANIALTNTDGNIDADTPQIGVGTTVATGTDGSLNVGTEYEILNNGGGAAAVAPNITGTSIQLYSQTASGFIPSASAHTLYLNVAHTWAGAESTGVVANGKIYLEFTIL
jgi:hypothetical protein